MDAPATVFAAALAEGRLVFQRCASCRSAVFPPRVLCPACGERELRWEDSGLQGAVYSQTTVRSREGDRQVALIDVDEGFRVLVAADGVAIADRVRLRVDGDRLVAQRD